MNIIGTGIDAVEIERFEKAVKEKEGKILQRIFTLEELKYVGGKRARFMHMAGKFAAKEAVKKALPDGARIGLSWADIEILNGEDGKPYVRLHGEAERLAKEKGPFKVLVSISHTRNTAISNAMVVKNGE
ncbi:MAG: holo-ACP synthase [Candidatus Omnitrophota bacterium]